jgi:hypothetical protein
MMTSLGRLLYGFLLATILATPGVMVSANGSVSNGDAVREVVDLNFEWRFNRLDIENDVEASPATYNLGPEGLEAADYDDAAWQAVDLPHDWARTT